MIKKITFTGADDSTYIPNLLILSKVCSNIEWGILISKKNYGNYRYPSEDFFNDLYAVKKQFKDESFNLSLHICGSYVRNLLKGDDEVIRDLGQTWDIFSRVQLNFHSKTYEYDKSIFDIIKKYPEKEFIFQYDEFNNQIVNDAIKNNITNCSILFDLSGGAGILPEKWSEPLENIKCGYAGGLSPENLSNQIILIESIVKDTEIWIDMETHVRSNDDSIFDLIKIKKCIDTFKSFKNNHF